MIHDVITVDALSKCYRIGQKEVVSDTLSGSVISLIRSPLSNLKRLRQLTRFGPDDGTSPDVIWAIKDVSFKVKQGEVVGVIGRNGAGKSTLLKILSRITEPTSGRAVIHGRISSLLEVGTGFHPELTGRENIYLNGTVLGMSKTEIDSKFDEIVTFSELDMFLDTPVKRYSSGMKVRLAFAVAAHLEPEILLIDEVLAVGDAIFQKKCLGKMNEVAAKGRTVLFVSHNMGAVNSLCTRAILLKNGVIAATGLPVDVTAFYLSGNNEMNDDDGQGYKINKDALKKTVHPDFSFTGIEIVNLKDPEAGPKTGDPIRFKFYYQARKKFMAPAFVVSLRGLFGHEILRISTTPISGFQVSDLYEEGQVELDIEALNLVAGSYVLDLSMVRERVETIVKIENIVEFSLAPSDIYGSGTLLDQSHGIIVTPHQWRHQPIPATAGVLSE